MHAKKKKNFLPSVTSCFENRGFVGFESPFNHRVACYCHYLTWWSLLSKRSCLSCEQKKFLRKSRNEFQSFTKKIQKKKHDLYSNNKLTKIRLDIVRTVVLCSFAFCDLLNEELSRRASDEEKSERYETQTPFVTIHFCCGLVLGLREALHLYR